MLRKVLIIVCIILAVVSIFFCTLMIIDVMAYAGAAPEHSCIGPDGDILDTWPVYCTASYLHIRKEPGRDSAKVGRFEDGMAIHLTGERSGHWCKCLAESEEWYGWVHIDYITERLDSYKARNISGGRVFIRELPEEGAKTKGYVKAGKTVTVKQTLFGWGKTAKGWVNLSYFEEVGQ